jgi:hypothetical protein
VSSANQARLGEPPGVDGEGRGVAEHRGRPVPTDEEAQLAALLAVLALVRADGDPAEGGVDGTGRTGGEALARWRAGRLAAVRSPLRR